MSNDIELEDRQLVLLFIGATVTLIGGFVLIGWFFQSQFVVQFLAGFASMKFNTALCFVLTGIGQIALVTHRTRLLRITLSLTLLIATLILSQWYWNIDLHIDNLFVQDTIDDPTAPPGRTSIPTAVCFLLTSLGFALYTFQYNNKYVFCLIAMLGGIVLALGLVSVVDYLLSIYSDYGWGTYTLMAVHTAIAFIFVGIALIQISKLHNHQDVWANTGELFAIALALVLFCVSVTMAIESKNVQIQRQDIHSQLDNQIKLINIQLNMADSALHLAAEHWEAMHNDQLNPLNWQQEANLYINNIPYMQAMGMLTSERQVPWFASTNVRLNRDSFQSIVTELKLSNDRLSHAMYVDHPIAGKLLVISHALYADNVLQGHMVSVLDIASLLQKVSQLDAGHTLWFTVTLGSDILFTNYTEISTDSHNLAVQCSSELIDLKVDFSSGLIDASVYGKLSGISVAILTVGGIFTLSLVMALYSNKKLALILSSLNKEKEQFRLVIESAPGAMLLTNEQGEIELLNTKTERLFGYKAAELMGQNVDILLPEQYRHSHAALRESYTQAPRLRSMAKGRELFGVHQNGQLIPVEIELCPIRTNRGLKVLASIFDLSERSKQLLELKRNKEQIERAGRMAKIGSWHVEMADRSMHWTEQTYSIFEVPTSVPLTLPFTYNFFSPDNQKKLRKAYRSGLVDGAEWKLEMPVTTLLNNKIWLRIHGQVEYVGGKMTRIVGSVQDITDRHQVQLELERRNQELNNFAYIASHDLKSPLRGIEQLASWLDEDLADIIDSKAREHLRLIRSRINRMENLLDDLLAYSRAGRQDTMPELVNIGDMVKIIFGFCNTHDKFSLNLKGHQGYYLLAKTPLELVLRNLISNAMKHHDKEEGHITITLHDIPQGLEISVADDGPGIPEEHTERVFGMFQTLQSRDKVEGSGMGLAIVKKVLDSYEASIRLVNNYPRGAKFIFTWPAKEIPK